MAKPDTKANGKDAPGALCHCGRPARHTGRHRGGASPQKSHHSHSVSFSARADTERTALQARHDKLAASIRAMQIEAQAIMAKLLALKALEETYAGSAHPAAKPLLQAPAVDPAPVKDKAFRIGQRSY